MGDAGAFLGSSVDFMSDRMAEQHEARQRDIDRAREDAYNNQQQRNWQTQFNYQKELNEKQMMREDNAIQRSVADHEKAGFNKLLAVGNQSAAGGMTTFAGSAGGGVSSQIPQSRGTEFLQLAQTIMDNKVKQSMISKSKAEADYTNQKTLTEIENTELTKQKRLREEYAKTTDKYQRSLLEKQIEESQTRINTARRNLDLSNEHGLPVGIDWRANNKYQLASQGAQAIKDFVKGDDGKKPNINKNQLEEREQYTIGLVQKELNKGKNVDDILSKYWDSIPGKNKKEKSIWIQRWCF